MIIVRVKFGGAWCNGQEHLYLNQFSVLNAHIRSNHGRTNYLASSMKRITKHAGEGYESFAVTFLLDLARGGRAVHCFFT